MIIVDLDNCISDDEWRANKILPNEESRWKKFHAYHCACIFDEMKNLGEILKKHKASENFIQLAILTSRPIAYCSQTKAWLKRKDVEWTALFMREGTDFRPSSQVKKDQALRLLKCAQKKPSEIICAYDDKISVIEMYREIGINAELLQINKR